MLDKFLVLLERFVVAHELIAANSAKQVNTNKPVELNVEGEDIIDVKPAKKAKPIVEDEPPFEVEDKPKAKPAKKAKPVVEVEDDLADEEPEVKQSKEENNIDTAALREEITNLAKKIGSGDSDEACEAQDELFEDLGVTSVSKIKDKDVPDFFNKLNAIYEEFYA